MGWRDHLRGEHLLRRATEPMPEVEEGRTPDLSPDEVPSPPSFVPLGGRRKLRPVKGPGSKYTEMPRNPDGTGKWWSGGTGV